MNKPRVYVETTIPSFYCELRSARDIMVRRDWTRRWWQSAPERYELVTSLAVLEELTRGIPARSAQRLALVRGLPVLSMDLAVAEIVEAYVRHKVMLGHIRRVNTLLGLFVPSLVTPLELLGGSDEEEPD